VLGGKKFPWKIFHTAREKCHPKCVFKHHLSPHHPSACVRLFPKIFWFPIPPRWSPKKGKNIGQKKSTQAEISQLVFNRKVMEISFCVHRIRMIFSCAPCPIRCLSYTTDPDPKGPTQPEKTSIRVTGTLSISGSKIETFRKCLVLSCAHPQGLHLCHWTLPDWDMIWTRKGRSQFRD